ncbi:hypothetical protein ACIOHC_21375 [Streptomyces sp. NPDC088252]|uniref:hypothetical protein n=1 Tax=unclassified Streptomyces TaxID=2593676 RepID=UPI0038302A9B
MNAKRVNAAAGVIHAAQKTRQTAAGVAMCLEAAGLLQSPESAAEQLALLAEVDGLRARVAELETDLAAKAQDTEAAMKGWGRARDRVAELEAASPWDRAVTGLNALVDADIAFWIEPDGHISGPFSDEHIEWDLKARRWVLTHDEDGAL